MEKYIQNTELRRIEPNEFNDDFFFEFQIDLCTREFETDIDATKTHDCADVDASIHSSNGIMSVVTSSR